MSISKIQILYLLLALWPHFSHVKSQVVQTAWQSLPNNYRETKNWTILGQGKGNVWLLVHAKGKSKIENRNLRMQVKQSLNLPKFYEQSRIHEVLDTDTGTQLIFDLFNASNGDHGLFIASIPKDSIKPNEPKLLFETKNNDPKDFLEFSIPQDNNQKRSWLTHINCSKNRITLNLIQRLSADLPPRPKVFTLSNEVDGFLNGVLFVKCLPLQLCNDNQIYFLFRFKKNRKERSNLQWGLAAVDISQNRVDAFPLNQPEILEQDLVLTTQSPNNLALVHGFVMDPKSHWPVGTSTYSLSQDSPNGSYSLRSVYYPFNPAMKRNISEFRANEGNLNLMDLSYLKAIFHNDLSTTLIWRRRFKSSETLIQYSQGMPIYREIIRYHSNDVVISNLHSDGTEKWSQIVPMNLTTAEQNKYHENQSFELGGTMLLTGYQSMNNKTVPFILTIHPNGNVYPTESHDFLKNLQPEWSKSFVIDPFCSLIPSQKGNRGGLLYFHCTRP